MPSFSDVASLITALAAVGAVVASLRNGRKINAVHVDVNSRLTQLLQATGDAARLEGAEAGRKAEEARVKTP